MSFFKKLINFLVTGTLVILSVGNFSTVNHVAQNDSQHKSSVAHVVTQQPDNKA